MGALSVIPLTLRPRTSWTGWDQLSASNGSLRIRQRRLSSRGVAVARANQEPMAFLEDPCSKYERCCGFEERPCGDVLHPEQIILASAACAVTTVRDAESWVALGDAGRRGRRFRRRLESG